MEEFLTKSTKYVEENTALVGGVSTLALIGTYFAVRNQTMQRNVHDYDNQITGAIRILNNEDHVLKGDEFKSAAGKNRTN